MRGKSCPNGLRLSIRFVQIIDGTAKVCISDKHYQLGLGQGIVIPAHAAYSLNANEQFKMISTIIKSGYEI